MDVRLSRPDASQDAQETHRKVLVLQGGGALGGYQAGAFGALCANDFTPDWIAGISIGAINAAIIAGNPPETRSDRLREFWEMITAPLPWTPNLPTRRIHALYNEFSASLVATFGVPGFFRPRVPPALLFPSGDVKSTSYYDTTPLRETLERLVDFDRINSGETRLSVGAVNVATGNMVYFDNRNTRIRVDHIMASAALPPAFPAIEIDGAYYWDGGVASNTPLDYVLNEERARDMVIFQIDLFSARGPLPVTISDAIEREKDIRYSSRTRTNTEQNKRRYNAIDALRDLVARLPKQFDDDPAVEVLKAAAKENAISIVHLIHRSKDYDSSKKGYEFSRLSMLNNWQSGKRDVELSMTHPECLKPPANGEKMVTWDFTGFKRQ